MVSLCLVLVAGAAPAWGQDAATSRRPAQERSPEKTLDPTRPLSRLDLRVKYVDVPFDLTSLLTTVRLERPVPLGGGWELALRLDLPVVHTDRPSPDNPDGGDELGLGDILTQGFLLSPVIGRFRFGTGAQLIWPTASHDEMGTGKYQLAPSVLGVYSPPELRRGSFVGLLVRDFIDYGGDARRQSIHELSVQPLVNVNLPNRWFVGSFPDIRINWEDEGRAFVPLSIVVGKYIGENFVTSIEINVPVVDDSKLYDWQIESRFGVFF